MTSKDQERISNSLGMDNRFSNVSNPVEDGVFIKNFTKKTYIKILVYTLIDLIGSCGLNYEYFRLYKKENIKNKISKFLIFTVPYIVYIITFIILISLKKSIIIKFLRIANIIIEGCYSGTFLILRTIKIAKKNDEKKTMQYVFMLLTAFLIMPIFFSFFYLKPYFNEIKEYEKYKKELEHDNFLANLIKKVERGDSRWTNTIGGEQPKKDEERKSYDNEVEFNINENGIMTDNKGNIISD